MEKQLILSVKNLQKTFGENKVLKGVNLDVYEGDVVAIIGPSGCGKSTFLRCVNCLEDPTGGTIMFQGEDLADMKVDINIHRQKIGMVFQQFNLFNNLSVLDNITLAPRTVAKKRRSSLKRKNFFIKIGNLFRKEKKVLYDEGCSLAEVKVQTEKKALELLQAIGLEEKASAYPSQLSGGQKQRIAIARAILRKSPIIVLDEATASVDVQTERQIQKAIKNITGKQTIIAIAHRLSTIQNADRIFLINDGGIVEQGSPKELMEKKGAYYNLYMAQFADVIE